MPEIYRNVLELVMRRGKLLHIVYVLLIAPARIGDRSDSSQRKVRFALMTSFFRALSSLRASCCFYLKHSELGWNCFESWL